MPAQTIQRLLLFLFVAFAALTAFQQLRYGMICGRSEQEDRQDDPKAQEYIEAEGNPSGDPLVEAVRTLNDLALKLKAKSRRAGAIDFDRPEMKVEVDEEGRPINVYEKVSKEANWLVEQFMLLANRTVAEFVATDGKMNGLVRKNATVSTASPTS